jgi:hypothetical protein
MIVRHRRLRAVGAVGCLWFPGLRCSFSFHECLVQFESFPPLYFLMAPGTLYKSKSCRLDTGALRRAISLWGKACGALEREPRNDQSQGIPTLPIKAVASCTRFERNCICNRLSWARADMAKWGDVGCWAFWCDFPDLAPVIVLFKLCCGRVSIQLALPHNQALQGISSSSLSFRPTFPGRSSYSSLSCGRHFPLGLVCPAVEGVPAFIFAQRFLVPSVVCLKATIRRLWWDHAGCVGRSVCAPFT